MHGRPSRAYKNFKALLCTYLFLFVLSGSNQRDGKGIRFGSIFWDVWRIHGFTCRQTLLATWLWFGFCVSYFLSILSDFLSQKNLRQKWQEPKAEQFAELQFLNNEIDKNPTDLHLIFDISSLKNQVWRTWFFV